MRSLLILCCCAVISTAQRPQSIREVDWRNFSYPLLETNRVPDSLRWMPLDMKASVRLMNGSYIIRDDFCSGNPSACRELTFGSASYGELTGIKSIVAAVTLTYHSGGTAHWQYVYLFRLESGGPRLFAWLRTGSRADQGLREASFSAGELVLVVNDPDHRQGDCCSDGSITTRYRFVGSSFTMIGAPAYKTDPPRTVR
jgi:hypothetical protein